MKCKIIFNTRTVPTFEDFEKSIYEYEACSMNMLIEKACKEPINEGYLLTSIGHSLYRFEYNKSTKFIFTEIIGELKPKIPLTFDTLRKANVLRLPEFKNSKGLPAHSKEDGSDWSPADWLGAVLGELGEYANIMKKVKRGDFTIEEAKPLIEKELADVMTYLDILAFRVGVDLAKATQEKFNEVSERVGCSLRIENNEVVRKKREIKAEEFKLPVTVTNKELRDAANLGSLDLTTFSIDNRKSYVSDTKEELQEELAKIKENTKARNQAMRQKTAKQIADNWIGTNKISDATRAKIEDLIEKDISDLKKSIKSENGKVSAIELIETAAITGVIFGEVTKLKVDILIKNDLEEFKAAKQACKIPREEIGLRFQESLNSWAEQMFYATWLEENKRFVYPLRIPHEQIVDVFAFDFHGLDNGKQYRFYSVKKLNCPIFNTRRTVCQAWLFDFFSKQLGTKIVGMLINGSKENTKLNSGDMIQFYDDRNILWNFRLVKASEKNVEIAMS